MVDPGLPGDNDDKRYTILMAAQVGDPAMRVHLSTRGGAGQCTLPDDAGDIERMTVRDGQAVDCWQDGFHLDGSWNGHRQRAEEVLFERCRARACGWRSGTGPSELYQSGFYVQSARLVDCDTERCRKAGFLCKNQEAGGLVLERCSDTGSAYSLVIEYAGTGRG